MGLLMGSNIAPLGKSSTTLIARVRSLTSVTTPVSLVIHSSQSYSTVIYTLRHTFKFPSWEKVSLHPGKSHTCVY